MATVFRQSFFEKHYAISDDTTIWSDLSWYGATWPRFIARGDLQPEPSIKNRDLCKTQPKTEFHLLQLACKWLPFKRHELLLFWFYILMSHSFYIHMETSVCHPLPSLPSFIYLLCSGIAVSTLCILRPSDAISLLCFPSSVRPPRCDPGRFHFSHFPSNLFLY